MDEITRRRFLSGSGAALVHGAVQTASAQRTTADATHRKDQSRPANLVLFMPDELRADALACYGNPVTKTPNFDKLAAEGTRFERCHVSYPICGASRCSLLTGWPTSVRGHRSQQYFMRADEPNLFRYLRQAGYDVFWFGKNDALASESFESSVTAWNFVDGHDLPSGGGEPGKGGGPASKGAPFLSSQSNGDPLNSSDYHCVQAAVRILERAQKDRPFCIFLPLTSPHPPYNAPGEYATMYSPAQIDDLLPPTFPGQPAYMEKMRVAYGMQPPNTQDLKRIRASYYGKVSYSDWLLGLVMEALERTGHANDTALTVLSDHGDYAGDYGLVEKWPSGMEDCMTHVPLISRMPGGVRGHVIGDPVEQFDVMSTCLELAGVQAQHTNFSRSFVAQMQGAAGDPDRAAFTEGGYNTYEPQCFEAEPAKGALYYPRLHMHHSDPQSVSRCAAVNTKEYRFVSRPQGTSEFYVLKDDPKQLDNRYSATAPSALQQQAERRLLHWYVNTTGISPWGRDSRGFPPYIPFPDFSSQPSEWQILDQ